jgi:hypothetical protein
MVWGKIGLGSSLSAGEGRTPVVLERDLASIEYASDDSELFGTFEGLTHCCANVA